MIKTVSFILLLASPLTHSSIIHEYDVSVKDYDFKEAGFFYFNGSLNQNDIFYKYLPIKPFSIQNNEQHTFVFNLNQTVWLYDLGLSFGADKELVGSSMVLDASFGNRDLDMDLFDMSVDLAGHDENYNPVYQSHKQEDSGYSGSGISVSSSSDVTSDAFGIDTITISFSTNNVTYNGSDMFTSFRLKIIGDHVSVNGPASVSEPSSLVLLFGGLIFLRRRFRSTIQKKSLFS